MLFDIPVFKNKDACVMHVKNGYSYGQDSLRFNGHVVLNSETNKIQLEDSDYMTINCVNGSDAYSVVGYNNSILRNNGFCFIGDNLMLFCRDDEGLFWFRGTAVSWKWFDASFNVAIFPIMLGTEISSLNFNKRGKMRNAVLFLDSDGHSYIFDKDSKKIEAHNYWFIGRVTEGVSKVDAVRRVI